ncbi:MAG TPA: hypothetical protein PKI55_12780 [Chitinophagaceae bacterium]|nr:hypothetical protein [Chitinophagaceae bacterium]
MPVKNKTAQRQKLVRLWRLPDASRFKFPKGKAIWQIQRKEKGKVLATAEKSSVTRWWGKDTQVIKLL